MTSTTADHTTTISGFRHQGEGTYTVTCTCGWKAKHIAYYRDALQHGSAHRVQVAAGVKQT